jgi:hypothetical protein
MMLVAPWNTSSGASKNDLDIDLTTQGACLIGYGSSSWTIQYADNVVKNRTIIIPPTNDRAFDAADNVGGPAGIKLGRWVIFEDGSLNLFDGLDAEPKLKILDTGEIKFGPGGATPPDCAIRRSGTVTLQMAASSNFVMDAGSLTFINSSWISMAEATGIAAPAANSCHLYAEDNGAGKTRLVVRFPTGAAQVLATEP